jgi:hypothetical protein
MNARWKLNVLTPMPLRGHPGLALRCVPTSAQWVLAIRWAAEVKTPFLTPGLLWGQMESNHRPQHYQVCAAQAADLVLRVEVLLRRGFDLTLGDHT